MTSVQCTFAADTTFTVPAWVTSLVVDAVGGNGAAAVGAGSLGSGANGSELQTRLNVAPNSPLFPGQVLTVQIGGNAVGITGGAHGGGDGDYNGAPASADEVWSGGGGGATSLLGTADHVLAAAGGGGGGGGAGACTSDPCSGGSGGAGLDPTGQDGEGPTGASGGHGGALSDGGAGGAGTTSYGAGGFSPVGQQGGDGGPSTLTGPGGGGGGGYAGGGGGGAGGTDGSNFGGGGGGAGGSSHPDVSIAQNEFVSVGDGTPRLTIAYDKQNPTLTVAPTPSAAPQGTASQAVVSLGGVVPTGTITFELHAFSGGTCSGDPLSSTSIHVGDAGTYYGPLVQPPYGTYSWSASYSGDDDTLPAAVACGDPGTILTVQDLTAPAASLTSTGPATQLGSSIPVAWSATDSISGVASYDVRDKRAAWNGSFGSAALWRSETTSTSGAFPASSGYEYCFSVRARDNAGNVSPWSGWKCAARPLDDRSLTRSTGWSRTSISSFYLGTATTTTKAGRSLTRTGAIAGRAVLVAGTGPRQGRVTVYYNGKAVKTLSLASTTSHSRVLFSLPKLTRATTVVIKTLDAKTVRIDGLLLARV